MMRATEKSNNRTGLAVAPEMAAELQSTIPELDPARITEDGLARVRNEYAERSEPVGTMPPPVTLGGMVRDVTKRVMGQDTMVLMDKLGERLAFERTGVRLYQGLISKFDVHGSWDGGPTLEDLQHIRDEEHAHFKLMERTIRDLGGDPTAMTPSANLHGEASKGLPAVIADPRTDLREGLEAILIAELVDNDCWETLIDLARGLGQDDHADEFETALDEEREHLEKVRTWLATGLNASAKGDPSKAMARRRAATKRAAQEGASDTNRVTKSGTPNGRKTKSASGSSASRGTSKAAAARRRHK
jgi:ferritin-like protein